MNRFLQMYDALKSYFLSLENPSASIETFFENDFRKCYLLVIHLLMSPLQTIALIQITERETNSLFEIMEVLTSITSIYFH